MSNEACPLPTDPTADEEAAIRRMLKARTLAVVGLSDDPMRPSNDVSTYLQSHGYEIIPVNPASATVMGKRSYKSLGELPSPPDVALVFRRPEHCGELAKEAIAAGAKGVWLQAGIRNEDARELAEAAGIPFVQDRCMKVEHMRHARQGA